jgi:hypothetical protein
VLEQSHPIFFSLSRRRWWFRILIFDFDQMHRTGRGFLSGQAFEPEVVRQMSLALETICEKFGMELTDTPATRVVAQKIIELAQRGVRDAPSLSEMTLKELKDYLPFA